MNNCCKSRPEGGGGDENEKWMASADAGFPKLFQLWRSNAQLIGSSVSTDWMNESLKSLIYT